jgi:hypothetical protein
MSKKFVDEDTGLVITYHLPQQHDAKYLVVVADRGMTTKVNHFTSFKETKKAFKEIANDYGYKPKEINASDYYDVSIWELIDSKYEKVYGY